jgi:monoamine oxidase
MKRNDADVIVIGGGAAGLAAAVRLSQAGVETLLLEARSRLGGRIDTRHLADDYLPCERGAEFVHGKPTVLERLLDAAQMSTYEVAETHWQGHRGRIDRETDVWHQIEQVMERLDRVGSIDLSFVEFLRRYANDLPPEHQSAATHFVEGFNAADARLISVEALRVTDRYSQQIEGDRAFRIVGGYAELIEHLRRQLPDRHCRLRHNAVVTDVAWRRGSVEVTFGDPLGGATTVRAPAVVVTLPLSVLQAKRGRSGAVRWEPALAAKQVPLAKLRMGPVVKVVLDFCEPFWETHGAAGLGFLHAPDEAFHTWWTTLPLRTSRITAWAGGPRARALSKLARRSLIAAALESLARVLGMSPAAVATQLVRAEPCNWQRDPFTRGAYSYATVGGADAARQLAEPLDETLFFAGEATHTEFCGTVSAALESGERAANEVLKTLGR